MQQLSGLVTDVDAADYPSLSIIPTTVISAVRMHFRVAGYALPGDGGAQVRKRISAPGVAELWHTQSADGAWWEMVVDGPVPIERLGGGTSKSAAANVAAIAAAMAFAREVTAASVGVYEVDGTLVIRNGATLVGRRSGQRPTLQFPSTAEPSNTTSRAAIALDDSKTSLVGWEIEVLGGDYRRTIDMGGGDSQVCTRNKITVSTLDVASDTHFAIFCADDAPYYRCEISENEVTGTCNRPLEGIQVGNMRDGDIVQNYIHDIAGTGADKFIWGIYCSNKCYGTRVNSNRVENVNTGGIHIANHTDGVTNDFGRQCSFNSVRNVLFIGISLDNTNGTVAVGNDISGADLPVGIVGSVSAEWSGGVVKTMINPGSPISVNMPLINVGSAVDTKIRGVTFGAGGDALHGVYSDSARTVIAGCSVLAAAPKSAIRLNGVSSIAHGNNIALSTDTAPADRIDLGANDCVAVGNIVTSGSAQRGVRARGDRCLISGNRIAGGSNNIWLDSSSTSCETTGNLLSGATSAAFANNGTGNLMHEVDTFVRSSTSSTNLANAAHAINTVSKVAGKLCYVTSNATTYRARGAAATDVWDPVGGGTAVAPA